MSKTLKSVLQSGAQRYLDGELAPNEFARGMFMAIAEAPDNLLTKEDLIWLAKAIASAID